MGKFYSDACNFKVEKGHATIALVLAILFWWSALGLIILSVMQKGESEQKKNTMIMGVICLFCPCGFWVSAYLNYKIWCNSK